VNALAALLCVLGVPIAAMLLVWWCFEVPLTAYRPSINDEVAYWHQALTFSRVGFAGGYYTLGELTNPSGFTPFGPHGPGYAVIYGSIGRALGWYRHTPVVLNLAAIGFAAWAFVSLTRLNTRRRLLLGVLLVTFWPLLFWSPTAMQEGFHYAGAIAAAGLMAHVLADEPARGARAAGWVLLTVLAYVRPSWAVLLPVFALASTHTRPRTRVAAALMASLVLAALVVVAYSRSTAPYPVGFFFLRALTSVAGASEIWGNLSLNAARVLDLAPFEPLEQLHRVQYTAWVVALACGLAVRRRRAASGAHDVPFLLVAGFSVAAAAALLLALYSWANWAEHRVVSAFLLFGAAVCVAAPGRLAPLLAGTLVVTNVLAAPVFVESFRQERADNYTWDRRGWREFAEGIQGTIVYRPQASRWCNTLLTAQYPPHLIAVPAGIGLSVVREADQLELPPRSRYLLLDAVAMREMARPLRTRELARFAFGTLYLNLESGCE
jgi:hypothetical protein